MKKISQVVLTISALLVSFSANALDCGPLDPRQQVGKKVDQSIEGAAETLIKLMEGTVSYRSKTEQEVKNLYQNYPNADKLVIKGKLIYTFCTFLEDATDLDSNEKFTKLNLFMSTILDSPDNGKNQSENRNKSSSIVESDEFVFELKQCKGTSSAIRCSFLVTNVGDDRSLRLYGHHGSYVSRIFLDNGDEVLSSMSQLGSSKHPNYSTVTLLTGVPVKASLQFKTSGHESNKIAAIDVRANKSSVQFRNIPIN